MKRKNTFYLRSSEINMLNFVYAAFAYIFVSSILDGEWRMGGNLRRKANKEANASLVVDCNFLGMISSFFHIFPTPPTPFS